VAADLSDPASIARLVKEIGEIDILVNNAGFWKLGPTAEVDVASFDSYTT
jgi:short-subunit dehydrogenase